MVFRYGSGRCLEKKYAGYVECHTRAVVQVCVQSLFSYLNFLSSYALISCTGVKYPGDDCPPVWGRFMPSLFHYFCLFMMLTTNFVTYPRNMWARVAYAMHHEVARIAAKCKTRMSYVQTSMELSGRLSCPRTGNSKQYFRGALKDVVIGFSILQ